MRNGDGGHLTLAHDATFYNAGVDLEGGTNFDILVKNGVLSLTITLGFEDGGGKLQFAMEENQARDLGVGFDKGADAIWAHKRGELDGEA